MSVYPSICPSTELHFSSLTWVFFFLWIFLKLFIDIGTGIGEEWFGIVNEEISLNLNRVTVKILFPFSILRAKEQILIFYNTHWSWLDLGWDWKWATKHFRYGPWLTSKLSFCFISFLSLRYWFQLWSIMLWCALLESTITVLLFVWSSLAWLQCDNSQDNKIGLDCVCSCGTFKGVWYTFWSSNFVSIILPLFWKRIYCKWKELAPLLSKFFPCRADHFSEGAKRIKFFPFRADPFSESAWKQTGSNKSYLPCWNSKRNIKCIHSHKMDFLVSGPIVECILAGIQKDVHWQPKQSSLCTIVFYTFQQ